MPLPVSVSITPALSRSACLSVCPAVWRVEFVYGTNFNAINLQRTHRSRRDRKQRAGNEQGTRETGREWENFKLNGHNFYWIEWKQAVLVEGGPCPAPSAQATATVACGAGQMVAPETEAHYSASAVRCCCSARLHASLWLQLWAYHQSKGTRSVKENENEPENQLGAAKVVAKFLISWYIYGLLPQLLWVINFLPTS